MYRLRSILNLLIVVVGLHTIALGAEDVLHAFDSRDGAKPYAGSLIMDAVGNVYGTTEFGGAFSLGTVFELSPTVSGTWQETILHNFRGGSDGANPYGGLTIDSAGNLYGTTTWGGGLGCSATTGCGTVYKLKKAITGGWTEIIMHRFSGIDGEGPFTAPILDSSGNLYGTTAYGGTCGNGIIGASGTVFIVTHSATGWTEGVLHTFCGIPQGCCPAYGKLTLDGAGNIYGTASSTIFKLTRTSSGWQFGVIHTFSSATSMSVGGLTWDAAGNLYGADAVGSGNGNVFELMPSATGWNFRVLYTFKGGLDGSEPFQNPVFDNHGNLFGTTYNGGISGNGCLNACGTIYRLTPQSGGPWKEAVVHRFGDIGDGYNPIAGVLVDSAGHLYGTTTKGGGGNVGCHYLGCGIVYRISP